MQYASISEILRPGYDWFDITAAMAAAALLIAAMYLGLFGARDADVARGVQARAAQAAADPALLQKVETARLTMEAGQVREAVAQLGELSSGNPLLAEPHALLGQAHARLMDYPKAVREYRLALQIDADYVDAKSGKFIGKRIKSSLRECLPQFQEALKRNPDDQAALAALADARYLERMLAGGCE